MNKKPVKIVTIGGGSSYTPELMEGFILRYEELPIKEIWLVDIEEGKEKLNIVGEMAQRMWDASPYKVKIYLTLDRREALKDADFVTTQFRVGMLEARIKDERIPGYHGMLGQETNGAGGILKAFRTIPVIFDIIKDMKELCPNAWFINFTNPSGMVTEAIIKHAGWKKCVGLCNVPVTAMIEEPKLLGVEEKDLTFQFAGVNHFHWHKVYDKEGNDVTMKIMDKMYEKDGAGDGTPANIIQEEFNMDVLKQMQVLPCGYHRYYYLEEEMLAHSLEDYAEEKSRAEVVKRTETELFELYKDPKLDYKPEQLKQRGGAHYSDAACECINAIYNNKKNIMAVSTQNNGAIPELPNDCIVEVSSVMTSMGPIPLAWGKLNEAERGWLQIIKAMEECTIKAAITGDYGLALQAFMLNPLIRGGATAKLILDELLVAHEKYLPQFADKIKELKAQGVASKDHVVMKLIEQGL